MHLSLLLSVFFEQKEYPRAHGKIGGNCKCGLPAACALTSLSAARSRIARTRTERFSRRSFIGCHIVSGFICIVKPPIMRTRARHATPRRSAPWYSVRPGKNPFPTAREGVVAARNSPGGIFQRRIFMHRRSAAPIYRSPRVRDYPGAT